MIKISNIVQNAIAGSEVDLDFVQKTATVFGQKQAADFFGIDTGSEKLASTGIGFENVVAAALQGSEVDIDYVQKLASVISWEEVEKLAVMLNTQQVSKPGITMMGLNPVKGFGADTGFNQSGNQMVVSKKDGLPHWPQTLGEAMDQFKIRENAMQDTAKKKNKLEGMGVSANRINQDLNTGNVIYKAL